MEEIRGRFFRTAEKEPEEEPEEVPEAMEDELAELHRELDELEKELEKLDGVEKPEESPAAHPIIEVVDDMPVEEPERED